MDFDLKVGHLHCFLEIHLDSEMVVAVEIDFTADFDFDRIRRQWKEDQNQKYLVLNLADLCSYFTSHL